MRRVEGMFVRKVPFQPSTPSFRASSTILALSGPGIRANSVLHDACIADVAPTILYLMGEPVPTDMDGHVLEHVLAPEWLAERAVRFVQAPDGPAGERSGEGDVYSESDSAAVEERLAGLGYLS